jgi:hypothetical protein
VTQEFGDFDEDDVIDDELPSGPIDWASVIRLQERYDAIAVLPDPKERKIAAKALIRELNGETSGPILVT